MINQIEHNEVKSSQISENEVVGSKDSSGTIIQKEKKANKQPDGNAAAGWLDLTKAFNNWRTNKAWN